MSSTGNDTRKTNFGPKKKVRNKMIIVSNIINDINNNFYHVKKNSRCAFARGHYTVSSHVKITCYFYYVINRAFRSKYPASRGFSLVFLSVVLPFSSLFWLLAFCFGCFCAEEKTSADSRLGFLLSMREMKMRLPWNFWVTCR